MFHRIQKLSLAFVSATLLLSATAPAATPASAGPGGPLVESGSTVAVGFRRDDGGSRFGFRRDGRGFRPDIRRDRRGFRFGFRRDRRFRRIGRFIDHGFFHFDDLPKECKKYWWLYQTTGNGAYYLKYRRCVRSFLQ